MSEDNELQSAALAQVDRIKNATKAQLEAQTEISDAHAELARLRLQVGGSNRAFHRSIDTLMSW